MVEVDMSKVVVRARIENIEDLWAAERGLLPADRVRSIDIHDALVDTGATDLMVPTRLVNVLGLKRLRPKTAVTVGGTTTLTVCQAVRLTIQGRECTLDVHETGNHLPVLIGQMPLEALDWVVDCQGQRLVGNPAHGGEHMVDAFGVYC